MYRAMSCGKGVTRFGAAEERDLRPDGRGELPVGRRRGWRGTRRDRGGDHAGGRARRPRRRRGQRAGLSRRGPLGGVPATGARLLLGAGHPATRPDDGPRDRGRRLPPAVIPGPAAGVGRPARHDAASWRPPYAESVQPARPAVAARPPGLPGATRLVALAPAAGPGVLGPVAASPPPLTAGPARVIVVQPRADHVGQRDPQPEDVGHHGQRRAAEQVLAPGGERFGDHDGQRDGG